MGFLATLTEREILTQASAEDELAAASADARPRPTAATRRAARAVSARAQGGRRALLGGRRRDQAGRLDGPARAGSTPCCSATATCRWRPTSCGARRPGAASTCAIAATFPDDARLAAEHKHDVVLIGALRARHALARRPRPTRPAVSRPTSPRRSCCSNALRAHSAAPILIDNLPEPTVQPLGLAERGPDGHRNRFRLANIAAGRARRELRRRPRRRRGRGAGGERARAPARRRPGRLHPFRLARLDAAAAGEREGRRARICSPISPPLADARRRRSLRAREGDGRARTSTPWSRCSGSSGKKCVIVDLDGVLWPGVLAETGAPFAWDPEISGPYSYIGLYFGLHEALLA